MRFNRGAVPDFGPVCDGRHLLPDDRHPENPSPGFALIRPARLAQTFRQGVWPRCVRSELFWSFRFAGLTRNSHKDSSREAESPVSTKITTERRHRGPTIRRSSATAKAARPSNAEGRPLVITWLSASQQNSL
ncbi:hypothetical protein APED_00920 [Acanthopleuribacter pedis]